MCPVVKICSFCCPKDRQNRLSTIRVHLHPRDHQILSTIILTRSRPRPPHPPVGCLGLPAHCELALLQPSPLGCLVCNGIRSTLTGALPVLATSIYYSAFLVLERGNLLQQQRINSIPTHHSFSLTAARFKYGICLRLHQVEGDSEFNKDGSTEDSLTGCSCLQALRLHTT